MRKYRNQNIDKLEDKAKRLYKLDWCFKDIGIAVGRHERTIKRWYDRSNWEGKKRREGYVAGKGFVEKRKEAKILYEQKNYWPKKIANECDVSLSAIYSWRKLDHWKEK